MGRQRQAEGVKRARAEATATTDPSTLDLETDMSDTMTFNFSCPTCGEAITWPEDATDDTPIVCKSCDKEYGTYAELQALAMSEAKAHASKMFKDAFKGLKGWKVS